MPREITVGEDIASYCTKCRLELAHVITVMVGGDIIKVKCNTCGSEHRYRGAETVRKIRERTAGTAKGSRPSPAVKQQAEWETCVSEAKGPEIPYDIARVYCAGDVILHSLFGKGVVRKTLFRKCEVIFRDKERLLASANG